MLAGLLDQMVVRIHLSCLEKRRFHNQYPLIHESKYLVHRLSVLPAHYSIYSISNLLLPHPRFYSLRQPPKNPTQIQAKLMSWAWKTLQLYVVLVSWARDSKESTTVNDITTFFGSVLRGFFRKFLYSFCRSVILEDFVQVVPSNRWVDVKRLTHHLKDSPYIVFRLVKIMVTTRRPRKRPQSKTK